jgi:integrase
VIYKRGAVYWYKFRFAGMVIRESTKTSNKELARKAERKRRLGFEESYNGVTLERPQPKLFSVAAKEWLELKEGTLAAKSYAVEKNSLKHLKPFFDQKLLTDINAAAIARYVGQRRKEKAADKSIKLELGTLRGILRRAKLWGAISDDDLLPKLRDREDVDVGRAITADEETSLLTTCRASRSRGLYTAVVIALNTGMREGEIRQLRWSQIDFDARTLTVGKAKTSAGTGRAVPMNDRLTLALRTWSNQTPDRKSDHHVFPAEQYGQPGEKSDGRFELDPTKPIGSWKTAWRTARRDSNVKCRFHDLRHSAVTRLLEAGVSFPIVASLLGWSPSTTTKMAKRYGHIGNAAHRAAVTALDPSTGRNTPPATDTLGKDAGTRGDEQRERSAAG